jgi:predicted acyltransferase
MILVNNQGSGAHPFWGMAHARWNGWTPADLVFPTFLFVVGASLALALGDREGTGGSRALHVRIARRAVVLFTLGIAVHALPRPDWGELRIMGVLQRIALTYALAALAIVHLRRRTQVTLAVAVLLAYWAALAWVPVPGHGAPALLPDANLPGWIDRALLGPRHVYGNGFYDPEGLASTLPATVSVLAGFWAMTFLRRGARRDAARLLTAAGAAAAVLGLAWGLVLPINKRLWTSSFVLLTAGVACLALAAAHALIDGAPRRRGRSLEILGRNAIVAFVASEELSYLLKTTHVPWRTDMTIRVWSYADVFAPWAGPAGGSLAYAAAVLALWWAVCWVLWRRRLFIRV